MEGSAMSWVIGLFALGIGTGVGVLLARTVFKDSDDKKAESLNQQIEALKNEHQEYRQNVDQHFEKTSELVFEMTQYYRKVYDHLSEGAQNLCINPPEHLKLAKAQGDLYEAQPEAEQLAHQQEEPLASQEADAPVAEESKEAAPQEQKLASSDADNLDDDVGSETGIELDVNEKQKGEQPTLH